MGTGTSTSKPRVQPRPQTSKPAIHYKPDSERLNRFLQTLSRKKKRSKYPGLETENEDDDGELARKQQEKVYILKQLYKRMDPAVMKSMGDTKGEIKLSFKYDSKKELLLVKVVEARELGAEDFRGKIADPYVTLELLPDIGQAGMKTTRFAKKTLSPIYNEIFTFPAKSEDLSDLLLRAQVLAYDPCGRGDFIGERIIHLQHINLSEVDTSWYDLQPETDLNITGSLDLTLSFNLPDVLIVTVHGAKDLIHRDDSKLPDPYVKVLVSGIPKVEQTKPKKQTCDPEWEESFEYAVAREELADRHVVLHVLDKALIGNTENMGQVIIDLDNFDVDNGYHGSLPLADLRNSEHVRTKWSQTATVQEFKEALYAHSVYNYPKLIFKDHKGNKIVKVSSRKARSTAKLRIIDGSPT